MGSPRPTLSWLHIPFLFHADDSAPQPIWAILDGDGSALWHFDPMQCTFKQPQAAKRTGLLDCDITRICLLIDEQPPGTGNGIDFWFGVFEALPYLDEWLKVSGAVASTAGPIVAFRKVVARLRTVGRSSGGKMKDFERLFAIPRTTAQIATLLRMEEEDVPAVAHLFGMKQTSDGYWRPDINRTYRSSEN